MSKKATARPWEVATAIESDPLVHTKKQVVWITSPEGFICEMVSTDMKHDHYARKANAEIYRL